MAKTSIWLGFAVVILATSGLIGAAWMFRYEPIHQQLGNVALFDAVWDRWQHRFCMATTYKEGYESRVVCTKADMDKLLGDVSKGTSSKPTADEVFKPRPN